MCVCVCVCALTYIHTYIQAHNFYKGILKLL